MNAWLDRQREEEQLKRPLSRRARIILLAILFAVLSVGPALVGCSDAMRSHIASLDHPHHIILYSGALKVGEWDSTGDVENQSSSDGWYFEDALTRKKIEVCGTVIITVK